jgi:hypothetical protein
MILTEYYEEFLRYYDLAKQQQKLCNLGNIAHKKSNVGDDLMENVELYDVVERKYAGFSQIVNDIFYQKTDQHPYIDKIKNNTASQQRMQIVDNWNGVEHDLVTWLYVFLLHRLTGSAINYGQKPSGYHNTLLFDMHVCRDIQDIKELVRTTTRTFYTSIGYQFPRFPKPTKGYKRGGDYFLCEYVDKLAEDIANFIEQKKNVDFRDLGEFMFKWNNDRGLVKYKFQYAAFLADIADWFPKYINKRSHFYYGSNAVECISYLAKTEKRVNKLQFLDSIMDRIYEDTKAFPYNAEDVCCDFIRWVENYIKPGSDYEHLDRDKVWSSCRIKDHPKGRQKHMLKLKLVDSFNNMSEHPSDYKVLDMNNMTVQDYKKSIN